jgi:hypothetical protein
MTVANKLIQNSDYNNIRTTINNIMGTGGGVTIATASRGYGQIVNSRSIPVGDLVSQRDWDLLRFDIVNARIHQIGSGSLIDVNENTLISAAEVSPYVTATNISDSDLERFKVAAGQFVTDIGKISTSREWGAGTSPTTWRSEINSIIRLDFLSANDARSFFNSGGEIRITSSRINPPSGRSANTSQSTSWTTLLSDAGTQAFGGLYPAISSGGVTRTAQNGFNFYNLTSSFVQFFNRVNTTPYAANNYRLEARCNVPNNAGGTATQVDIRVRFIDSYTDPGPPAPGDDVDGLFSISIDEKRAESVDFNPITSVSTTANNSAARNTITVATSGVPYVFNGMRVTDSGTLIGLNRTIVSSSTVGSDTIFVLNSNTNSVVPVGTPVTFQNRFIIPVPTYSINQTLQGS